MPQCCEAIACSSSYDYAPLLLISAPMIPRSLFQSFDSQTFWPVWALKWFVSHCPSHTPLCLLYLALFHYEYALIELLPRQTVMRLQTYVESTTPLFPRPSLNYKARFSLAQLWRQQKQQQIFAYLLLFFRSVVQLISAQCIAPVASWNTLDFWKGILGYQIELDCK